MKRLLFLSLAYFILGSCDWIPRDDYPERSPEPSPSVVVIHHA